MDKCIFIASSRKFKLILSTKIFAESEEDERRKSYYSIIII
jgi:hypothetical protein